MMLPELSLWDQAKEILVKLRQNLPLTIATVAAICLILRFWKEIVEIAKQALGLIEPRKEEAQPALPEGEVIRVYGLEEFRGGLKVPWGWRAAVVDAGVVQCEMGPGRIRRRAAAGMIRRAALGENARVILWRDREFPVVLFLDDLFAADHQPMQLETKAVLRLHAARLLRSSTEDLSQPPDRITGQISERIRPPAQEFIAAMEGLEPYRNRQKLTEWSSIAKAWIAEALQDFPFELVRVITFRLSSPELDKLCRERGELALQGESVAVEVERNRVRGALRQAVLAGKLEEIRDRSRHEDAVRVIEQEQALRERALRQELAQSELNELEEKVLLWRRKRDILLQALGPVAGQSQTNSELAEQVTDALGRSAVEAAESPFSAHEREQIRTILQSCRLRSARPDEILSAVAGGTGIHGAMFDPLAKLRGTQTLRVGDGWRIFDGDALWQVRLVRIATRRHGFLWRKESAASARFEVRASPDNRRFEQDVTLDKGFRLAIGPHEIPVEYLGGGPSQISIRIPEQGERGAAGS